MFNEEEIWLDITGIEKYQVSNYGSVRSTDRTINHPRSGKTKRIGKLLKQQESTKGYLVVRLYDKNYQIHRLVGLMFVENTENKPLINHKDGIKSNNYYKNLEWCTNQENIIHSFVSLGRIHHTSKKVAQINGLGEIINEFNSTREAGRKTGIYYRGIAACAQGKLNHSGGYNWKYV